MKKLLITIAAVAALTACSPAESGSVKTNPTLTPSPITSPTTTPTKECLNAGCVTAMPTEQYNKIRTPKPATITKKPKAKKTPVKTITTKPKPTKTKKPKPSTPSKTVHPGAYCAPAGATGVAKNGKIYTCKGPGRNRWRR